MLKLFRLIRFIFSNLFFLIRERIEAGIFRPAFNWKAELSNNVEKGKERFKNKGFYAIVTGGNDGIGKEVTFQLLQSEINVILACRSTVRGNAAVEELRARLQGQSKSSVECWECDVGNLSSVRSFASQVIKKNLPLIAVVCNAGIMATPAALTKDGFEEQWAVNHLGHYLLVKLLYPVISKNRNPTGLPKCRVVMVSSQTNFNCHKLSTASFVHHESVESLAQSYHPYESYYQSKFCNVCATWVLSKQWNNAVVINAVHPGAVYTSIAKKSLPWILSSLETITTSRVLQKTVAEGASYVSRLVLNPSLTESGNYFNTWRQQAPNPLSLDPATRKLVMQYTDDAVKPFMK